MAINRIAGQTLQSELLRDGENIAFQDTAVDTPVLQIDIVNSRVGINTDTPAVALDVVGNIESDNVSTGNITAGNVIVGSILIPATGNIDVANVNIVNLSNPVANADAATKFYVDSKTGNVSANVIGNLISMGTNSQGAYVSNAVTLTANTYVSDGIALLNQVLGKLVPPAPSNFPGGTTLSLSGLSSYRMANITQTDNTPGANKSVSAGTTITNVLRAATYATNTISYVGPGDAGIIRAVRNGTDVGNVTLNTGASPSGNGTYGGNLVITNNYDYHSANANIAAGFWYVFSAAISGASAPAGWNEIYIADSAVANTNTPSWYYDNSSPSTPSFSSTTFVESANTLTYSSTIPHYTSATQFTLTTTVADKALAMCVIIRLHKIWKCTMVTAGKCCL